MPNVKFRKKATAGGMGVDVVVDGLTSEIYDVATAGQYDHIVTIETQNGTLVGTVSPENVTVIQNSDNTDIVIPLDEAVFSQGGLDTLTTSGSFKNTPWDVKVTLNKWLGDPVVAVVYQTEEAAIFAPGWEKVNDELYVYGGTYPVGHPNAGHSVARFRKLNLTSGAWTELPFPGYTNRFSGCLFHVNGWLYTVAAGQVAKYNIAANTWTTLAAGSYPYQAIETSSTILGDNIYEYSGVTTNLASYVRNFRKYNIPSNTWSLLTVPSAANGGFSARLVSVGNEIYMTDGYNAGLTNKFFKYNVDTAEWTKLANQIFPVMAGGFIHDNGKLYYLGGLIANNGTTVTDLIQVYTIATNTWETLPTRLPAAGRYPGVVRLGNGFLVGHMCGYNGEALPGIWHVSGI